MTKRFSLTLILLAALVRLSAAQVLDTQLVQNNSTGGGCTATANSCASFTLAAVTSVTLQVSGTWTGTLTFEATTDGTNWNTVGMKNLATGVDVTTTTANGSFATANVGLVGVRARATAAITGSASVAAARGYASVRSLPFSSAVPVPVTSGGTGFSSYAVGDLLTADTTTTLAKLADVAAGSVLVSGGVATVPAYSATPSATSWTAAASGTCATPRINFTGNTNTGVGWLASNNAAGCANGATIFDWSASRVLFAQPIGIGADPVTPGVGLYLSGAPTANYIRLNDNREASTVFAQFGQNSSVTTYGSQNSTTELSTFSSNFDINFRTINVLRWKISGQAGAGLGHLLAGVDNTYDIGATGATRPRTGYFGTSVISPVVNATTGVQINGAATSGQFLVGNGTNFVGVLPALMTATPADQTGNATATFKMNGLGAAGAPCTITPVATGRVIFFITGDQAQNTTADGVTIKLAYGTGAAPANAAAASGTVIGATSVWTALTGQLQTRYAMQASVTGLALNTAVWFDVQIADVTGGTASLKNVTCSASER